MMFGREQRLRFLLVMLPAVLGLIIALVLQLSSLPNPLLVWRFTLDLGTFIFIVSLLISVPGVLAVINVRYWSRRAANRAKAERKRQREARDQFLGRLDHELKNPLAILQMSLANLETSQENDSQIRIAQEQLARLNYLGRSLRTLSSLANYPLEQSMLDIPELLAQVIQDVQWAAGAERPIVQLSVQQVPWPPRSAAGDHDLLYLAFRNLIENAVKFTEHDGLVEVRVSESRDGLVVQIADSGRGITEADLPHLFTPLFRGENARGIGGSGWGLVIAKAVFDRHQAQIDVQSRPGEGTIFRVHLPLDQAG